MRGTIIAPNRRCRFARAREPSDLYVLDLSRPSNADYPVLFVPLDVIDGARGRADICPLAPLDPDQRAV